MYRLDNDVSFPGPFCCHKLRYLTVSFRVKVQQSHIPTFPETEYCRDTNCDEFQEID